MGHFGQIAYEAYAAKANGISLVSGAELPPWMSLNGSIQEAWDAAAQAVVQAVMGDGG
jgi:hypothetical protein